MPLNGPKSPGVYHMATHSPFFIYQFALTLGPFEETLFQSTNHYSQISHADSIERFIAQSTVIQSASILE